MESREGGPEEPVSESDDGSGDGTGGRGETIGMGGYVSTDGGTWKSLPKHLGYETGCLCGGSPPCEWKPTCLH